MKLKFKYLPALSLLLAANAQAGASNVPVNQDGWIGPEGPSFAGETMVLDGGIGPQLNVATPNPSGAWQYTRKAWFGFDLTALKAALGTNNICSASITFQLTTNVASAYNGENSIRFYGVTNVSPGSPDGSATDSSIFNETMLTWNNAPGNISGDVLAGDKVNGAILGDVPVPNPAASGIMVLSGPALVEFLESSMSGTNAWATVATTFLGQDNTGYQSVSSGVSTGLSFISKEAGAGSAFITVDYQSEPCPVVLESEPQGGCFYSGSTVNLSVSAFGTPQILYQWMKNGTNLPGAIESTLTLPNVSNSDVATYGVVVTNAAGSVTSQVATVSLLSPPVVAGGFEQAVGTNTPIGYWRFNETSPIRDDMGTNIGSLDSFYGTDYYANLPDHGWPGAIVGDPDTSTHFNAALSQLLSVPYFPSFNPLPPFSVECWANADTTSGTLCVFGSLQRSPPSAAGWVFYMNGGAWNFRMGNTTNNYSVNLSSGAIVTNQWYHLVGTYDGTTAIFYVNGVSVGAAATADFEANPSVNTAIGGRGDNAFYFSGAVDEAAIYTNLLSASDVASHYANGTNAARAQSYSSLVLAQNPIGYWRLDDPVVKVTSPNRGSLCSAADAVYEPYGPTLGILGIATGVAGPQPPAALGFEANNLAASFYGSTVQVPPLNLNTNEATFVAWINPNGAENASAGIVFNRSGSTVAGLNFGPANDLRYTWANSGNTYNWASGLVPVPNQWSFVALVIQPTYATMYLYDGTNLTSAVNTTDHPVQGFTGPTVIGQDTSSSTRIYAGEIDEVAIFNQALTPAQILGLVGAAQYGTAPAHLVSGPFPQEVSLGEPATFSVTAGGSLPISYQWSFDGLPIAGATASSFTIPSTTYTNAGIYSVKVSNGRGSGNGSATLGVTVPDPAFANLTNGLVLHLKFDGDYSDSSGRGNNATGVGSSFVAGKLGQAVYVGTDGTNVFDYVQVLNTNANAPYPDLQFTNGVSFTVSFWVNYTGLPNDLPMIGNATSSTYNPGWVITDDTGKIEYTINTPSGTGFNVDPVPGSPKTDNGVWHNVVISFDMASLTANTYVDGVLVDSRSIAGIGSLDTGSGIYLGSDPTGGYNPQKAPLWYNIDDVGIWRRALSRAEAESIYLVGQNYGVSFDTYGPVQLTAQKSGKNVQIVWQAGTLLSAPSIQGPWTPVGASAPFYRVTPGPSNVFYRVQL
jgi:hypothetical protein